MVVCVTINMGMSVELLALPATEENPGIANPHFSLSSFFVNRAKKNISLWLGEEAKPVKIIRAKGKRTFPLGEGGGMWWGVCLVGPALLGGWEGELLWVRRDVDHCAWGLCISILFACFLEPLKDGIHFFKLNE